MQRLGIYPGTFDPLHKGHLSFALESIKACSLDCVVFLPENQPRSKINVTAIEDRFKQIKAMIEAYPELDTQLLESSQFTVAATLPEIQKYFKDAELTMLVGSDVALSLDKWDGINTLLENCNIAIGMRDRQTEDEVHAIVTTLKKRMYSSIFTIVRTEYPSLASSSFRK